MPHPLLAPDEPHPADVRRAGSDAPVVLICDHAGRTVPRALGDLGLPAAAFDRHIAWDIGAAALTARLGEALGACAVMQRYSRLVIDCNRDPARADAIPAVSDATPIPGNADLSPEGRAARIAAVHAPYHTAITRELDARAARGLATLPVFIHSFTPALRDGPARPWRFGVLHLGGSPASAAMLAALREEAGAAPVGDNQPYAMTGLDYSAPHHAVARGLDYLELEVRQDLLADADGVAAIAEIVLRRLPEALAALASAAPLRT